MRQTSTFQPNKSTLKGVRRFALHPLAIALCATVGLTGCMEWDNSDDYKDDGVEQNESGGGSYNPDAPQDDDQQNDQSGTFAGSVILSASGAQLANAKVCLDVNANENCDAGEPFEYSDENGRYSVPAPSGVNEGLLIITALKNTTINQDTGSTVSSSFSSDFDALTSSEMVAGLSSSNSSNLTLVEGVVDTPDGPLGNAEVCADLDSSGACEDDEPTTLTDENGRYEFTLPSDTSTTNTDVVVTTKPGETTVGDSGDVVGTEETFTGNVDVGSDSDQTVALPTPETTFTPKPDTGGVTKGNVIGYEGYLSGAEVCADLNFDGECGPDEPTTVSGNNGTYELTEPDGDFQIVAEAIANDSVNESTGETVSESYTIIGPRDPYSTEQVVSPIADRVSDELNKMADPDLDQAKQIVSEDLNTTNDPLSDYIADQGSSDLLEAENAERLERVVETIDELTKEINSTITETERQESGLSDAEIDQVVQDQVSNALPNIIDDVNDSLASDDPYDPLTVTNDPKYDPVKQQPDLAPQTADMAEIETRMANTTPEADLFYQDGYERFAEPDGETVLVRVFPHPNAPGKFYYEAIRRITTSTDKDQATVNSYLAVPRYTESLSLYSYTESDNGYWCAETSEYEMNCSFLNLDPSPFTVESWAGNVWRTDTLRRGMNAEVMMLEGYNPGEIIVTSTSNGLSALETVGKFELDNMGGVEVIRTLLGNQMPGVDFSAVSADAFGVDSAAFTYKAETSGNIRASLWPTSGTTCDTAPGTPALSEVVSCNLVYGEQPGNLPATSYEDLLYAEGALGQAYTGTVSGQYATGAIPIDGPGSAEHVMRLYGDIANEKGAVQVDRKAPDGTWETVSTAGDWTYETQEFPYISVNLPDAYSMASLASGNFEAGKGMIYQRLGYMRHGWVTPTNVSPEQLFGRPAHQFMVNREALTDIHSALNQMGVLEVHPYFWDEYQFYLEN